jgi:hypothetical protein
MELSQNKKNTIDYAHQSLNTEIRFISGYCEFTKEVILSFDGKKVYYLVGHGVLDTACCGRGGCGYANVKGFVEDYRYKTLPDGTPVSRITLIRDETARREIEAKIRGQEMVQQVIFDTPTS